LIECNALDEKGMLRRTKEFEREIYSSDTETVTEPSSSSTESSSSSSEEESDGADKELKDRLSTLEKVGDMLEGKIDNRGKNCDKDNKKTSEGINKMLDEMKKSSECLDKSA